MKKQILTIFLAAIYTVSLLHAQVPAVKAEKIASNAVKLDGLLNESVWTTAPVYTNFTHLNSKNKKAVEQTFFQVAASPEGLYWAFRSIDKSLQCKITARDGELWQEDSLELFISADDPLPEDPNVRRGRHFIFNALGARYDDTFLAGVSNAKWNSDWKCAARKNADGFTAEIFIPYYAFELDQAKKYWRFNVGRENYTGEKMEVSVWSPSNAFLQMDNFAVLEVPAVDHRRFNNAISALELKVVPTAAGTSQQLSGKITAANSGMAAIQAAARQNGKIKAFNRTGVKLSSGSTTVFSMPLNVGKSGVYNVLITMKDDQGKIFYTEKDLTMQTVPFTLKLENPVYRKSIFAGQKDKTLRLSVKYDAPAAMLKNTTCSLQVISAAGQTVAEIRKKASPGVDFAVDTASWQPGKYDLCVKSSGTPALTGELKEMICIADAPEAGNTVYLDKDRQIVLNGKRFFPRGFIGGAYEEELFSLLEASGYNTLHFYMLNRLSMERIRQVLDQAQRFNLKVIMYPYHQTGIGFFGFSENGKRNQPRMSDAAWERMHKMVNEVRKHPALLGWYLYDEPRGADFCSELRKVYQMLRETDPHHPVIGTDCSADGCIRKRDGYCDIHILDLYPHPLTDGTFVRPISAVMSSMKMVNENIGSAGAWFCPEAFTPLKGNYRTISYREIRCIVYGSIVNGATAIMPYKIGDPPTKYYSTWVNAGIFYHPDMRLGYLEGMGPELKALENVLLEPQRLPVKSNNKDLLIMRKVCKGKTFVFAVNPTGKSFTAQLHLPGFSGGELKVFNEKRTVKLANGAFFDQFEPYATHIYTDCSTLKETVNVSELENKIRLIDKEAKKQK